MKNLSMFVEDMDTWCVVFGLWTCRTLQTGCMDYN